MRKLLITRGAMGAGKSTWLKENNFSPFVMSSDEIRTQRDGLTLNAEGKLTISMDNHKKVWEELWQKVENKMKEGQFIVIDGTFQLNKDFRPIQELARRYFYDVAVIDFTHIPEEVAIERNRLRPSYKFVPEFAIKRAYERFKTNSVPNQFRVFSSEDLPQIFKFLVSGVHIDTAKYKKIHHIGDLQGCFTVFDEYLKSNGGMKNDELYIFVGDYVDRGIENDKVIQWLLNNYKKPNVVLLAGNHELHLMRYACKEESRSDEFNNNTAPQLDTLEAVKRDMYDLCKSFKDVVTWEHTSGKTFYVTHAGLYGVPDCDFYMIPSKCFWKGIRFADPVDELWMNNTADNFYQVHGHRNKQRNKIDTYSRSLNLESKVEFGGNLAIAVVDVADFKIEAHYIKNKVFKEK